MLDSALRNRTCFQIFFDGTIDGPMDGALENNDIYQQNSALIGFPLPSKAASFGMLALRPGLQRF